MCYNGDNEEDMERNPMNYLIAVVAGAGGVLAAFVVLELSVKLLDKLLSNKD